MRHLDINEVEAISGSGGFWHCWREFWRDFSWHADGYGGK